MPNLPNLSGSNISDTYTRVLHTDGNKIYDGTGSVVLGSVELSSLQTMNNNTISNADWTYVASMDQHVNESANPIFTSLRVTSNYDFKVGDENIEGMNYSDGKIQFANAINAAVNINAPYYKSGDSNALGLSGGFMKISEDYPIILNNQSTTCTDLTGSGVLTFGTPGDKSQHTLYGKLKVVSSDVSIGDGHISASGDMRATGSVYALTGSFGTGTTTITDNIETTGNISSSGDIQSNTLNTRDLIATGKVRIKGSDITLESGHISASGDIRATGSMYALTGSFGTGTTTITDSINTTGAITATGNIEGNALSGKTVQAEEIVARSGKTEITLGKVDERVTAILNGDLRIKGSDMFIGSGSISCSGEIHTTGSITAGGDITAGDNCTGSFDHIITLNNTIEFRDEGDKSQVKGYLKFDDTYGLQALGSNRAQMLIQANRLKTSRNIGGVSFNGTANIDLPGVNIAGNQDTTGTAANATKLETPRRIGGVSFDGSANINLPGVNSRGNQDTTGTAATALRLKGLTFEFNEKQGTLTITPDDSKLTFTLQADKG